MKKRKDSWKLKNLLEVNLAGSLEIPATKNHFFSLGNQNETEFVKKFQEVFFSLKNPFSNRLFLSHFEKKKVKSVRKKLRHLKIESRTLFQQNPKSDYFCLNHYIFLNHHFLNYLKNIVRFKVHLE